MMVDMGSPFGGRTRTSILVALRFLGESYARELARLLEVRPFGVQKALQSLDKDGLVAIRSVGRTRVVRVNPAYFAFDELWAYLGRLSEAEEALGERVATLRRRPRRTGKRL